MGDVPEKEKKTAFEKWLFKLNVSENTAASANQHRTHIIKSLDPDRIKSCSGGTKIYYGPLSPGCSICCEGLWSCCYINGLCTANCFFCPQDRTRQVERSPNAEGITFTNPDDYIAFLQKFRFKGVGFSGGEPLMVLDRLLLFIETIKKKMGQSVHVWIYTNGHLADDMSLKKLRLAGLDEIRFNISANDYDLKPVAKACDLFPTVSIEIPAIPEDKSEVQKRLTHMMKVGVKHLHLHQLNVTIHNYQNLIHRGYTIIPSLNNDPVVFESELAAIEILKYASDERLDLPVHYCSRIYKTRYQSMAKRRRSAIPIKTGYEDISDAGYIRRLSLKDISDNIFSLITIFKQSGKPDNMWAINDEKTELIFHPDLVYFVSSDKKNLAVQYVATEIETDGTISTKPVAEVKNLSRLFVMTLLNQNKKQFKNDAEYNGLLNQNQEMMLYLKEFEKPKEGLAEVIDSKKIWRIRMNQSFLNTNNDSNNV